MRQGWVVTARAALASAVLLAGMAPARADGGPGAEPSDVAGLAWREACPLPHAHVRPPIADMPDRLFDEWGLPRTTEEAAWTGTAMLLLGRAYELGVIKPADSARAAQLYCLALRRAGSLPAAAFLSRLYARGEGVSLSPTLARHFARIAAIHADAESFRPGRDLPGETAYPQDRVITRQLERAQPWIDAAEDSDPRTLEALAMRYLSGDGVPQSDLLGHHLYRHAAIRGAHEKATAGVTARYVGDYLDHHIARSQTDPWHRRLVLMALYNAAGYTRAPAAQRLLGRLHLQGTIVPEHLPAAVLWFRLAEAGGGGVTHDLNRLESPMPARVKSAIACRVRVDDPPAHPDRIMGDRGFYKVPAVCRE